MQMILLISFCLQDRLIISTGNLYQKREFFIFIVLYR